MSGLEKIHRERSLVNRRASWLLSPSYALGPTSARRATASVNDCAARNWSCPRALVGDRYNALARGSAARVDAIGNW